MEGSKGELQFVGTTACRFNGSQAQPTTATTIASQAAVPELADYSWPPTDEVAIMDSLVSHAARRVRAPPPDPERLALVRQKILQKYPHTMPAVGFEDGHIDEKLIRRRLSLMMDNVINLDAGPGVPYSLLAGDNKTLIANHEKRVFDAVITRLHVLANCDLTELKDPADLVRAGCTDPVRVFVKKEPHAKKKQLSKRWRLISSVSIVDNLIERLLFSTQNKKEVQLWESIPSAPGIGLSLDEGLESLRTRIMKYAQGDASQIAESDIIGFDWSVQAWELKFDAEMRCQLMGANALLRKLIHARVHCLSRSIYVTCSGRMIAQTHPGIQLSGSYNTSSSNSRIRVALAYLVGCTWAVAMGDDALEEYQEGDMSAKYAVLGHPIKMYTKCTDSFTFCSAHFPLAGRLPYPDPATKTLFRLLEQRTITDELIAQYTQEIRHRPDRAYLLSVVDAVRARKTALQLEEASASDG